VNKERLLNVARALRESPNPDQFNMSWFANHCGTPACAFGHYAARADLQSAFELRPKSDDLVWQKGGDDFVFVGAAAMLEHFDITKAQATELFCEDGCKYALTAIEAAEYIEAFVARGGK
jgi:hypothetical protein